VRNRIWHFALCDNTIHVEAMKHQGRVTIEHHICQISTDDKVLALQLRATHGEGADEADVNHYSRHIDCKRRMRDPRQEVKCCRLSLSILAACRQIHQEAALLPYKGNVFSVDLYHTFTHFLKALVPAQANAIEQLTTVCYTHFASATFQKLLRSKLKGLKELVCFLQSPREIMDGTACAARNFTVDGWAECLLQFADAPLTTAIVALHPHHYVLVRMQMLDTSRPRTYHAARQWTAEIERKLIASTV